MAQMSQGLSLLVAKNLSNTIPQAVFPCDSVKEILSGKVNWKNQLVCPVVTNAFKYRLLLSAAFGKNFSVTTTDKWCYCLFSSKDSSLSMDIHVMFSVMLFIFFYPIFRSDASLYA